MRLGGFCALLLLLVSASFGIAGEAHSSIIANWDKGARSWNNIHMTKIKASMVAAGHRVDGDSPMTSGELKIAAVYIIGEPTATPNAAEMALLKAFVAGGGMVMIFGDTGIELANYNNILAGIGSSITYIPTTIGTTSALPDGQFTRGPNKISGNSLTVSSGNGTAGGSLIDNNYVRFEQIGSGYVMAFGDRIDHNDVISDTNTALLLNAVSLAIGPVLNVPTLSAPALAALMLLCAALAAAGLRRNAAQA